MFHLFHKMAVNTRAAAYTEKICQNVQELSNTYRQAPFPLFMFVESWHLFVFFMRLPYSFTLVPYSVAHLNLIARQPFGRVVACTAMPTTVLCQLHVG